MEGDTLTGVEPIELDEKTLAGADYITGQVAYLTPVEQEALATLRLNKGAF